MGVVGGRIQPGTVESSGEPSAGSCAAGRRSGRSAGWRRRISGWNVRRPRAVLWSWSGKGRVWLWRTGKPMAFYADLEEDGQRNRKLIMTRLLSIRPPAAIDGSASDARRTCERCQRRIPTSCPDGRSLWRTAHVRRGEWNASFVSFSSFAFVFPSFDFADNLSLVSPSGHRLRSAGMGGCMSFNLLCKVPP
jgi:hypothetical protein